VDVILELARRPVTLVADGIAGLSPIRWRSSRPGQRTVSQSSLSRSRLERLSPSRHMVGQDYSSESAICPIRPRVTPLIDAICP
jgi:hypothetical protein